MSQSVPYCLRLTDVWVVVIKSLPVLCTRYHTMGFPASTPSNTSTIVRSIMSTGSHGNNEVEVVVLGVTADPVLASLEEVHIFGSLFPGSEPVCWSSYFLCGGQNSAPTISLPRTQGCACTVVRWKSMECSENFGLSCSALICPAGDMERQSKSRHCTSAVAKIITPHIASNHCALLSQGNMSHETVP